PAIIRTASHTPHPVVARLVSGIPDTCPPTVTKGGAVIMKHIPLSIPHLSGQEIRYVTEALETNWVAPLGPNVEAFEAAMKTYSGAAATLATSSGTAAIHLALATLDFTAGDDVFCQS